MDLPRPISPGQVYRTPITDGFAYYYICDMVTRQRVMSPDTLSFKIYRMLFNNSYGFVYRQEEVQHMEQSVLKSKIAHGEYVRTLRPKLDYEDFIDMLTEKPKRLSLTVGISLVILNLILLGIWGILSYG